MTFIWCDLSVQFSWVTQSCLTLCDAMDCSVPGFPVHHQLPELTKTHVRWVGDVIQPSHPLSSPSPPAFSLSQHQGLFQWVSSSHQVAKVEHHLWVIIVYNKSRKVRSIILVVEWNTNSLYGELVSWWTVFILSCIISKWIFSKGNLCSQITLHIYLNLLTNKEKPKAVG